MKTLVAGLGGIACSVLTMAIGVTMFLAQHPGGIAILA